MLLRSLAVDSQGFSPRAYLARSAIWKIISVKQRCSALDEFPIRLSWRKVERIPLSCSKTENSHSGVFPAVECDWMQATSRYAAV